MERSQLEVLFERERQQADGASALAWSDGVGCACLAVRIHVVRHREVCVVLEIVKGYTQRGVGLLVCEDTLHT